VTARSLVAPPLALAIALGGCASSSPTPAPVDVSVTPVTCTAPAALRDVSAPDHVVGDGTSAHCTPAALRAAAAAGGIIVFDCGAAPTTITLDAPVVFTKESVLDGGGLVTLSGGGTTRILLLDSAYDQAGPRLTVQRLVFRDGASPRTGDDTADGGAAIYRDGGSLTVVDCDFLDNVAPSTGPDLAGGAIYGFGGGETVIVGSTFTGNRASDGGAVGSLNGDLVVADSVFTGNAATGTGGNPGDGGCGGAIYMDGGGERTELCGVTLRGNTAGAIGGGFFRVSNDGTGSLAMNATTVDANVVTATGGGNAGGLYLQGLALQITNSTVSRNEAFTNGGIWIHTSRVAMTNVTVAENTATGSNGGGIWLSGTPTGHLLNCTIANNHATATDVVAGAIFGGGLTLKNTVLSGNTAMWSPGCDRQHADGGGNLQWPAGALCTASLTVADALLGSLGDHGGPTETMLPSAAGPAVGRGSRCPQIDQRGQPRGSTCTAGAVELP
jgi:parallel beta-helix repeat protein